MLILIHHIFFRNELAQAIRDIRSEYESATDNQRSDLHNRYMMSYNELVFRTQRTDPNAIQNETQRRQEETLRTTIIQIKNEMAYMKAKNEDLNNRIRDIQQQIGYERENGGKTIAQQAQNIDELRRKLERLQREYDEVTNMKTSLEKEINQYRDLLEGKSGLVPTVDHIVDEAQRAASERASNNALTGSIGRTGGGSTSIQRTYISSTGSGYGTTLGGLVTQTPRTSSIYDTLQSGYGGSIIGGGGGTGASSTGSYSSTSTIRQQQYQNT